jgi:hypothetical protein
MKLASALILAAVSSASAFVVGPTGFVTPMALQAQAAKSHEEDVELTRQAIISFTNDEGGEDSDAKKKPEPVAAAPAPPAEE